MKEYKYKKINNKAFITTRELNYKQSYKIPLLIKNIPKKAEQSKSRLYCSSNKTSFNIFNTNINSKTTPKNDHIPKNIDKKFSLKNLSKSMIIRNLWNNPFFNNGKTKDKFNKITETKSPCFKPYEQTLEGKSGGNFWKIFKERNFFHKINLANKKRKKNFILFSKKINNSKCLKDFLGISNKNNFSLNFQNKYLHNKIIGNFITNRNTELSFNYKSIPNI